ncbi:DeoR/GlpR family DNA-binding transcription regulator [Nocardia sp. NPDC051321]|uniref:DeoR/GlpR family DNA-binding transcription regulator n=1 Tax=Nocardia sp. NPDC051321 TaxID=3364323 RepID=UPI003793658A
MNRHARLITLLELITSQGHADVDDTAKRLGVSTITIRRDLNCLHERGLVWRTHGGAVDRSGALQDVGSGQSSSKQRIAQAAADMVAAGATVGLNGGTTTLEVARAIASRASRMPEDRRRVTIVTNAIAVAGEPTVCGGVKLVVTGGMALPDSMELTGSVTGDTLRHVDLDLAILGVDAFGVEIGARTRCAAESSIGRLMTTRARRVVIVAASPKLVAEAEALICPASAVHDLITDRAAPADLLRRFVDIGVAVYVV